LPPYEYHASTSELCQMLEKGHYGVELDKEALERIYLWIDMNAPWRGKWDAPDSNKRRMELSSLYANVNDDYEDEYDRLLAYYASLEKPQPIQPKPFEKATESKPLQAANFPFDAQTAEKLQKALGSGNVPEMEIPLSDNLKIKLVKIPAGEFVIGSVDGLENSNPFAFSDESPRSVVKIEKPFWIGVTEITNAEYEAFDPAHDTRYIEEHGKDHTTPGYIANHPDQPVARVSWQEAKKFCDWLSEKSGKKVNLPTEAQWEWAARSGSDTQFYFGKWEEDFSPFANLADADRRNLYTNWDGGSMIHGRRPYPEESVYPLRDSRFKDSWFIVDYVAQSKPNAWGLYDVIGNVSEWTRSDYKPYPYNDVDGRNSEVPVGKKVARGGSWADRPKVAGSATRYPYEPYQKVHNVGFRIVVEE
ncbi:MAG: formylglycine-generating enzyme family protein, partial [Thermoguttaceae bacterium]